MVIILKAIWAVLLGYWCQFCTFLSQKIGWYISPWYSTKIIKVYTFVPPHYCGFGIASGLQVNLKEGTWRLQGKVHKFGQGNCFVVDGLHTGVLVGDGRTNRRHHHPNVSRIMELDSMDFMLGAQLSLDGLYPDPKDTSATLYDEYFEWLAITRLEDD